MTDTLKHYHEAWRPMEDIYFVIDDKTGVNRTPDQIDALFRALKAAANAHDFDLNMWGNRAAFRRELRHK